MIFVVIILAIVLGAGLILGLIFAVAWYFFVRKPYEKKTRPKIHEALEKAGRQDLIQEMNDMEARNRWPR